MREAEFSQFTTDYISGVMSLRRPQKESLKVLESIINAVQLTKGIDLHSALSIVHEMYPICSNFERDFFSLTFALATGVGKTRLMGAFIAYLFTQHNIHNFFVVAPGTTVYDKLKKDLGDTNHSKYVFKCLSCFSIPPTIIIDEDYRNKPISFLDSDVRIFIFNIDKFNKENANMRRINEYLGNSFFMELSALPDLVLIMDESHHYRAERGALALNELNPLLGLELTATPLVKKGTKQVPFKNVVFEYPLSKAIEDGYTRTPYAVTRSDIDFYNFGDEQLDRMMLQDGLLCHEKIKGKLVAYAANQGKPAVKPFMLVVCKDTSHAEWVESYIKSIEFGDGAYKNKTITVHSNMKGSETEANLKLLLDVEHPDNPIEIVIHVNMLKEGWDVNNLYTIVPLRTAASRILREQMVGRGLRLPYGVRTGDKDVDAVMLTAHDKFNEILEAAQRGDSIFKAGNIIKAEDIEPHNTSFAQIAFQIEENVIEHQAYENTGLSRNVKMTALFREAHRMISDAVTDHLCNKPNHSITKDQEVAIAQKVAKKISESKDLGDTFLENELPLAAWLQQKTEVIHREAIKKFIPIPRIRISDEGIEEYRFVDFDIDLSQFSHMPIDNELLIQNLEDVSDRQRIQGRRIDFEGYEPKRTILTLLRQKPEINYERCSELLFSLINQICSHYQSVHGENGMKNVVMMYKRDITNKIYQQMMQHFYCENGFLQEEVVDIRNYNIRQAHSYVVRKNLFQGYDSDIRKVLFEGIKYGVFDTAKFDSHPELVLARVLERDASVGSVKNWLRPSSQEFNITYDRGHQYEPDFVVETEDKIYLVEIKGEDRLADPDVIAKKTRAIKYCEVVTNWGKANGYKEWKYLFIPSLQILENSSFKRLANLFQAL